jgi:diguanylate cyclase (GGDEF)-like protein
MFRVDPAVVPLALSCLYSLAWSLSLARRLRRIERTSKLDPLTGLGSGDWLQAERWPAALRSGRPLGVVYLDLDHLKLTNDTLGHGAGDQYIRTAAEALLQAVRRGVDEVFRTHRAGDEFEILLHGKIDDLRRCASSLMQRLSGRGISASLGLAYTTETRFLPVRAELRQQAEAACRQAKACGGGRAVLACPDGELLPSASHEDRTDLWSSAPAAGDPQDASAPPSPPSRTGSKRAHP